MSRKHVREQFGIGKNGEAGKEALSGSRSQSSSLRLGIEIVGKLAFFLELREIIFQ